MAHEYRHRRFIEFADTDMAGIVHFSRYFRFMEEAEHAFLRSLGLTVHAPRDGYSIGFPRLSARCEFLRPVRFEDVVETHLWVRRKGKKTITYQFVIEKEGESVARGEVITICSRCHTDGRIDTMAIPPEYADRIEEAPYPPLEFGPREG